MKKIFTVFIIYSLFHNLSLAEDRNFQSIGKVGGELYLLDYNSIKSGEGDEIKYIQLISFEKKQNTSDGKKYQSVQMYMKGKSEREIKSFLVDRYGEFILLKPKYSIQNFLLWLGPIFFLLIGFFITFAFLKKQSVYKEEPLPLTDEEANSLKKILNNNVS